MRFLFLGDVFAKPGRRAINNYLPNLKNKYKLDAVIANGENATHGFGLLPKHGEQLIDAGVDIITNGNHVWDQIEIIQKLETDERYLRPANFPPHVPGKGIATYKINGYKIKVINLLGQLGMKPADSPFVIAEDNLQTQGNPKSQDLDAIIIDIHAEATSEKAAMGYLLDGRVSLVVGTHTHVPTHDARILPNGTAYQTDCGMCGDYESVIGLNPKAAAQRFYEMVPFQRTQPAEGEGTLSGILVETNEKTGLATKIAYLRKGGKILPEIIPHF